MPCSRSKGKALNEEKGTEPCFAKTKWPEDVGKRKSFEYSGRTVFGASEAQGAFVKAKPVIGNESFIFWVLTASAALCK